MSLEDNLNYEKSSWEKGCGLCSGPRYILDTVLHHEKDTDALYKALRGLELSEGKDIIEIGTNGGGFCFLFAKTAKTVIGIDLLSEPLELAEKFKSLLIEKNFDEKQWGETWCHEIDWDVSNVSFLQGNAYELPLENNIVDVVFMYSCIEHFPMDKRQTSIKEAKRILRNGGLVIISTITDVDGENRENWYKEISEDVHPFGLSSLEDILQYTTNENLETIEANELWFGDKNKIKLAFYIGKKSSRGRKRKER